MKKLFILALIFATCSPASAKRLHKEAEYQKAWCEDREGIIEYTLPDNTRVDCLTDKYAVETGFIDKKYQDIGQALYYALKTGKKPGILTIIEDESTAQKHLHILKDVCKKHKIKLWITTPEDLN